MIANEAWCCTSRHLVWTLVMEKLEAERLMWLLHLRLLWLLWLQ